MIEVAGKRYGQSLFEAARDCTKLDLVFEQLAGLRKIMEDNQSFFKVLEYPFITLKEKYSIVEEVFSNSFDPLIYDFLKLLISKERVYALDEALNEFEELYYSYSKILKVQVITAFKLKEDYRMRLALKLKEVFEQDIVMEVSIDPSIVGGLMIKAGDKVIDATVKGKLDRMRENLLHDKTEVR
ncbi:MAG: ATP synthase F1 subunit delta [Pseudomonadota bacterium]